MSQKPDRPFVPGAFVSESDEESTRVAPLDTTNAGRQRMPRPAAGMTYEDENAPRSGPPAVMIYGHPSQPMPPQPGGVLGSMPPQGYPAQPPNAPQIYPPPAPHNPYAAPAGGYGAPQGGYGPPQSFSVPPNMSAAPPSMGAPMPGSAPAAKESVGAKWGALPVPKKILLILAPFALTSAGYMLLVDPPPPPDARPATASVDAGAVPSAAASAEAEGKVPPAAEVGGVIVIPDWPADVPCPPVGWPANRPPPCEPNSAVIPAQADVGATAAAGVTATAVKPAGATVTSATNRSLERQAVDAYAQGQYAKASELYAELAKQYPDNHAFSEAARIARNRAGTSAP